MMLVDVVVEDGGSSPQMACYLSEKEIDLLMMGDVVLVASLSTREI